MKKKILAVLFAAVLLLGMGIGWKVYQYTHIVVGIQPKQIMVDGTKYVNWGAVAEEKPDTPPDGTIAKVNDTTDYPDANDEANFGTVGMPYWRVGAKIVVQSGQYYVFNAIENQE